MNIEPNERMDQDDQCSICFVSCQRPVRCKGPCHKLFCLRCAALTKCSSDRCPHRCSTPFEVEPLPVRLFCPFSPKECILAIEGQKDLSSHHLICPLVTAEQKVLIERKEKYRCDKDHNLTFLPKEALVILYGRYWMNDARVECISCKQMSLCRSICLICSVKERQDSYCHLCRVPPCSKTKCPMGHKLKERKNPGKSRYCDLCDAPAGLMSREKVFGFCPCDFDLCRVCHSKLPQSNHKIPLKWDAKKIMPLSVVNDDDSDDSDWKDQ